MLEKFQVKGNMALVRGKYGGNMAQMLASYLI